jgi:hypothetical protein
MTLSERERQDGVERHHQERYVSWRWVAAAVITLIFIGGGIALWTTPETASTSGQAERSAPVAQPPSR